MRASSIYPGGPERASGDPFTDSAEVRAIRRLYWDDARSFHAPLRFCGPEQFESHEDYMAPRDAESWGTDDPFGDT